METVVFEKLPLSKLGEGPWWDAINQELIYVDINSFKINRFNPRTNDHSMIDVGTYVGFAVLDQNGKIIAGLKDGIYRLAFTSTEKELLAHPATMPADTRFNNGICDRAGRLWAGTMSLQSERPPTSTLYCLNQGMLHEKISGVRTSNGTGWSPDNKLMYYVDTKTQEVKIYDFDIKTGGIANPRTFAAISGDVGRPDGLTVNSKGEVLVALWAGHGVHVYSPDGKLKEHVNLPAPNTSSLTFGGPDLKTLFVTTAREGLSKEQLKQYPKSGYIFAVEMPTPGISDQRYRGERHQPKVGGSLQN